MVNNDGFYILVYPNVDYAFIVALLMIINEIKFYYDKVRDSITKIVPLALGMN